MYSDSAHRDGQPILARFSEMPHTKIGDHPDKAVRHLAMLSINSVTGERFRGARLTIAGSLRVERAGLSLPDSAPNYYTQVHA